MLVCCGNGKPWHTMDQFDRLNCNHDHCTGPIEENVEEKEMSNWNEGVIEGLCIARAFTRGQLELSVELGKKGRTESLVHILKEIEKVIHLERGNIVMQKLAGQAQEIGLYSDEDN